MRISKTEFATLDPYEIFSIPYERIEPLIYEGLMVVPNTSREFNLPPKPTRTNKDYSIQYNRFCAIQYMGDCWMYDEEIIPISVYTYERKIKENTWVQIGYIGYSIDDLSQGFWLSAIGQTKLTEGYSIIADYLEAHPFAMSNENFQTYFEKMCKGKFNVSFNFN
jgi:hypothetical protein